MHSYTITQAIAPPTNTTIHDKHFNSIGSGNSLTINHPKIRAIAIVNNLADHVASWGKNCAEVSNEIAIIINARTKAKNPPTLATTFITSSHPLSHFFGKNQVASLKNIFQNHDWAKILTKWSAIDSPSLDTIPHCFYSFRVKKKHPYTSPCHILASSTKVGCEVKDIFPTSYGNLIILFKDNITGVYNNDGILDFEHKSRFFMTSWDADFSSGKFSYLIIFFVESASLLFTNRRKNNQLRIKLSRYVCYTKKRDNIILDKNLLQGKQPRVESEFCKHLLVQFLFENNVSLHILFYQRGLLSGYTYNLIYNSINPLREQKLKNNNENYQQKNSFLLTKIIQILNLQTMMSKKYNENRTIFCKLNLKPSFLQLIRYDFSFYNLWVHLAFTNREKYRYWSFRPGNRERRDARTQPATCKQVERRKKRGKKGENILLYKGEKRETTGEKRYREKERETDREIFEGGQKFLTVPRPEHKIVSQDYFPIFPTGCFPYLHIFSPIFPKSMEKHYFSELVACLNRIQKVRIPIGPLTLRRRFQLHNTFLVASLVLFIFGNIVIGWFALYYDWHNKISDKWSGKKLNIFFWGIMGFELSLLFLLMTYLKG